MAFERSTPSRAVDAPDGLGVIALVEEAGERSFSLRPAEDTVAPPEDEDDAAAFVIDGHHKLRAYELTGVAPHCLDIAKISDEKACTAADLRKVVGHSPDLQGCTSHLMAYLADPR